MRPLLLVAALFAATLTACPSGGPGPGGLTQAGVESRVDRIFASLTGPAGPTGPGPGCAVGIQKGDRLTLAKAYGLADLAANTPITADSVFDLASVSKQITAATVLLLAAEGKVDLTRDVRSYVPELPDYGAIVTVNHLMQHTSGIPEYVDLLFAAGFEESARTDDNDALRALAAPAATSLDFPPGGAYGYNNTGYFLLSRVVLAATGMSLRQAATERIFTPLGMTATTFRDADTPTPANSALAYQHEDGDWKLQVSEWRQTGDGGAYSTIGDVLRWASNFWTRRVGGEALYKAMTTPVRIANGATIAYGAGVELGGSGRDLILSHTGSWAGYRSALLVKPDRKVAVAVLCNNATEDVSAYASSAFEVALA